MAVSGRDAESWKRMVLRSLPAPYWLSADAPQGDIVLSTRVRVMRNLRGHRFPHAADDEELRRIERKILNAADAAPIDFEVLRQISNAEREYLVGCRLVSHDFPWSQPGRALLLDGPRALSLMVNEEDHLRLQALTPGWSLPHGEDFCRSGLSALEQNVEFAHSPAFGFLAASPFNTGGGRRLSAMLHLIALAHAKRLPSVLKAVTERGMQARGLFGESSRAIGAFVQISTTGGDRIAYLGAVEYLLQSEREARASFDLEELKKRADQAVTFAVAASSLSLADALRILGWIRWAASAGLPGFPDSPRMVDTWLTTLELRGANQEPKAANLRADFLRRALEA